MQPRHQHRPQPNYAAPPYYTPSEGEVGFESNMVIFHDPGLGSSTAAPPPPNTAVHQVITPSYGKPPPQQQQPSFAYPGYYTAPPPSSARGTSILPAPGGEVPTTQSETYPGMHGYPPPLHHSSSNSYPHQTITTAAAVAPLSFPRSARRLKVPCSLPLEQSILLDFLASSVAQGGPTTEEEIVKREVSTRRNPNFSFFRSNFSDPPLLYYRWRLYSLLQGDTLLSWRTQPYQIELSSTAYVWVPPPPLACGPECLQGAYHPEDLMSSVKESSLAGEEEEEEVEDIRAFKRRQDNHRHRRETEESKSGTVNSERAVAQASPTTETTEEKKMQEEALKDLPASSSERRPPPCAQWIAKQCTSERMMFTVLSPAVVEEWRRLLALPEVVPSSSSSFASPSMAQRAEQWLRRDAVGQCMVFAMDHVDGMFHLLSILLDCVVELAYTAATPFSPNETDCSRPDAKKEKVAPEVLCLKALWYLFVLHDIMMNASNVPKFFTAASTSASTPYLNRNTRDAQPKVSNRDTTSSGGVASDVEATGNEMDGLSEGAEQLFETLYQQRKRQRDSSPPPPQPMRGPPRPVVTSPLRRKQRRSCGTRYELCGAALEMILPTLLEACCLIAAASAALGAACHVHPSPTATPPGGPMADVTESWRQYTDGSAEAPLPATTTLNEQTFSIKLNCADAQYVADGQPSSAAAEKASTSVVSPPASSAVLLLTWLRSLLQIWLSSGPPERPPASPKDIHTPSQWLSPTAGEGTPAELQYHLYTDSSTAASLGDVEAVGGGGGNASHRVQHRPLITARTAAYLKEKYSFIC